MAKPYITRRVLRERGLVPQPLFSFINLTRVVCLFKDARMVSRAYFKPRAVKKCSLSLYHFPSEHEKTPYSVTVLVELLKLP
jgi:hypothetical protein